MTLRCPVHPRVLALLCPLALLGVGPAEAQASCQVGVPSTPTSFSYTGAEQCFVIPANVTTAQVVAVGASSQDFGFISYGATATGTVAVTPGSTVYVEVGGAVVVNSSSPAGVPGGFNGGGNGGDGSGTTAAYAGGVGGGGASDVRTCSRSDSSCILNAASGDPRLIVAGGAGGGGGYTAGGSAGGSMVAGAGAGSAGSGAPGNGGFGAGGGAGGGTGVVAGAAGAAGSGGPGGSGAGLTNYGGGGGGGGGYTGGGGGGAGDNGGQGFGGAGGGGSSYGPQGTVIATDATDPASVTITPGPAIAVSSSQNPSVIGQSVTFTASVTGSNGTVRFQDGGTTIAGCDAQPLSGGMATCTTSGLTYGGHSITALVSGESSSALTQTVRASTSTALSSSQTQAPSGASVTFTATVSSNVVTSGTVRFASDGVTIGSCAAQPLSGGQAICTTSDLAIGDHAITAAYGGDANNADSTSPALVQIIQAGTSTVLSSSTNPSVAGAAVTFSATVSSSVARSGTVRFESDGVPIGLCGARPLSDGVASCTTSDLTVGDHGITAVYSGDAHTVASTSPELSQTVQAATPPAPGRGKVTVGHVTTKRATASIPLSCAGNLGATCRLKLVLAVMETRRGGKLIAVTAATPTTTERVVLASKSVTLTAGGHMRVKLTLNRMGKRLLAQLHRLPVKLTVTGATNKATARFTFRVPAKKP